MLARSGKELLDLLKDSKYPEEYLRHFMYKAWRAGYEKGRKVTA
jgi:hypothetical protein